MDSQEQQEVDKAPPGPQRTSRSIRIGRGLDLTGRALFPVAVGMVAGFYAADQGVRWLPTMLQIVLVVGIFSLMAMVVGRGLAGKAVATSPGGVRLRKRIIACLILALLGALIQLGVYLARQPCPLTSLTPDEFNEAFAMDSRRYVEHEQGMENLLRRLEDGGFLNEEGDQVLSSGQEDLLRDVWLSLRSYAISLDGIRMFYEDYWRFDSSRVQRSFHLRAFLLTYVAELALYEKAARFTDMALRNDNARKFLNSPSPEHELPASSLSLFRQELLGVRDQSRILAGQQYLKWLEHGLGGRGEARALNVGWLWNRIGYHLKLIGTVSPISRTIDTVRADSQLFKRAVRRVWFPAQKKIAEWTGDIRVRRIGWYLIDRKLVEEMDPHLEPGDIMMSRKNWYLSNVALPGFWPHALLYLGDPDKFASFFDTAEVKAWIKEVSGFDMDLAGYLRWRWPSRWVVYKLGKGGQPNRVLEAISEGVVFNTMDHAAGDYLVALRPRLSRLDRAKAILEAFGHLGKPYDFDFDFSTDHALVCTELVWRSYRPGEGKKGLDLPLSRIAGRQTLPANEIARLFADQHGQPDAQLDFVYFIDALEKERRALVADEEAFLESWKRPRWDIMQK